MNINKKIVRLTESQLHNMIAESVSQILMELDPRTYASARDKAADRKQRLRSTDFKMAAVDAWNRDYGKRAPLEFVEFDDETKKTVFTKNGIDTRMNYCSEYDIDSLDNDTGDYTYYNPSSNEYSKNYGDFKKATAKDLKNNKGWRVAREMSKGNGKYIKGKGWQ